MSKLTLNQVSKYVIWLASQLHQVRLRNEQNKNNAIVGVKYKLMSTYEEYQTSGRLLIQHREGAAYTYMTPKEICADIELLKHLHPLDVNIVTTLYVQGQKEPIVSPKNIHLVKQKLDSITGNVIYTIFDPKDDSLLDIGEQELLDRADLLSCLNGKDGVSFGFSLGLKHAERVKRM